MFDIFKKADLKYKVENITSSVEQQIRNRTFTASAAGEAPAVRTGAFRQSFHENPRIKKVFRGLTAYARVESNLKVGKFLIDHMFN